MKSYLPVIVTSFLFFSLPGITKEVGSIAPVITLVDENGQTWNSSDFLHHKNILIFFYPAAMTGGCTKQACSYRDDIQKWKSRDFEVVGISGDKSENLKLFKKPMGLILDYFPIRKEKQRRHLVCQLVREVLSRSFSREKDLLWNEVSQPKGGLSLSQRRERFYT